MTTEADQKAARDAALKEAQEHADRVRKAGFDRLSKGKPTPTQAENDRFALGEHILHHEEDGSDPDENQRGLQAGKPGSYQTRQATPSR